MSASPRSYQGDRRASPVTGRSSTARPDRSTMATIDLHHPPPGTKAPPDRRDRPAHASEPSCPQHRHNALAPATYASLKTSGEGRFCADAGEALKPRAFSGSSQCLSLPRRPSTGLPRHPVPRQILLFLRAGSVPALAHPSSRPRSSVAASQTILRRESICDPSAGVPWQPCKLKVVCGLISRTTRSLSGFFTTTRRGRIEGNKRFVERNTT